MNTERPTQDQLAVLVSAELRSLPSRQAPHTLEARVFAELTRRAALPWWRKNFLHWPLAARVVFLLVSLGVVRVALQAVSWTTGALSAPLHTVRGDLAVFTALDGVARSLLAVIPPTALYGAAVVIALLYVTLFGLGAAAYRTLYVQR